MPYKVLIVDDEKIIRMGIQVIIPWEELGVHKVFTAASTKEALSVIVKESPDIVLTDICMTELTGLDLIQSIKADYPNIKIIVLTGYDNFEYAQQCCRMQVQDFLLKPADEDELTAVIQRILAQLDQEKDIVQYQKTISRAVGISEQLKVEIAMRNLIHGRVKIDDLENLLLEYHYDKKQPMQIVIITPVLAGEQKWKNHNDLLTLSIKNICIQMFDSVNQGITFEDDDQKIIIALFQSSQFDEIIERVEHLKDILKDEYDIAQQVVLGSSVKGFGEMAISYNDANYLLTQNKNEIEKIVQSNHTQRRLTIFQDIFEELIHIMISNIGDEDKIFKAFDSFEKATISYNLSHSFVSRCCFQIASNLYFAYIVQTGESVENKLTALLDSLVNATRDVACNLTKAFIINMFTKEEETTHEIVSNAKRYINENLAEDLSVSNIATRLYITPNYFSRLFKKITNEGCNEYIVRKRIEKAKLLLESTSLKTGKIALMIGYRDTNYFSLAFKKHTGLSPTSYRENTRENHE